ncbi:hypothetical protein D3C84_992810 [compost metagenome]
MAVLWTDRDGNEKCVAYNFDASDQVVTIEGYQVSVRAKSFQVVELVETEAATH